MTTLLIALGSLVLYIIAYNTYGKWLGQKIFKLDPKAKVPSIELEDGNDYVPTKKGIVFGHHFTSIAGTGPIVGPALAVIWGWVPAYSGYSLAPSSSEPSTILALWWSPCATREELSVILQAV